MKASLYKLPEIYWDLEVQGLGWGRLDNSSSKNKKKKNNIF